MHLLFDLDGTLTDPKTGILNCFRYALEELGCAPPAEAELERHIGPPIHQTFRELIGTDDAILIEEAIRHYRVRFSSTGLFENALYDGIPEALEQLRSAGARLYLATSKPAVYAERIVDHFGLRGYFHALYGSELDGTRGEKKDLIAWILGQENLSYDRCRMIGDREYDAFGALANGVMPLGVLWGYGSEEELRAAGCVALYERPEELAHLASSHDRHGIAGR